jgi:hypothetical protein
MEGIESHVDFVPIECLPFRGRLGVAKMPGLVASAGGRSRGLTADLQHLVGAHRVTHLVSLVTFEEYETLGPSLTSSLEGAEACGITFDHFPVPAGDVPPPDAAELYLGLVANVVDRLEGGETVVLYSREGLGRCAMAAASVLVAGGVRATEALRMIGDLRTGVLAHEAQREFVTAFAEAHGPSTRDLSSVVDRCLVGAGWRFRRAATDDGTSFSMSMSTDAAHYVLMFRVQERLGLVVLTVRIPLKVPVERRHAVSAVCCHLNYLRILGGFEMDLRDGDLIFRTELQVVDGVLGPKAITTSLAAALAACDDALPLISRVVYAGQDPDEVLGLGS